MLIYIQLCLYTYVYLYIYTYSLFGGQKPSWPLDVGHIHFVPPTKELTIGKDSGTQDERVSERGCSQNAGWVKKTALCHPIVVCICWNLWYFWDKPGFSSAYIIDCLCENRVPSNPMVYHRCPTTTRPENFFDQEGLYGSSMIQDLPCGNQTRLAGKFCIYRWFSQL